MDTIRTPSARSSGGRNPRWIAAYWAERQSYETDRTRLAELEDEIAALRVQVQAEVEQHEAELAQALEWFERRLVALERALAQRQHDVRDPTTTNLQPRTRPMNEKMEIHVDLLGMPSRRIQIDVPSHHLRLGAGPHWTPGGNPDDPFSPPGYWEAGYWERGYAEPYTPLVEWLRQRRIHCRVHGPYFPLFGIYLTELGEVGDEHGTRIHIELTWQAEQLVEFLDPADEIRHTQALLAQFPKSRLLGWEGWEDQIDNTFEPDRTPRRVREELLAYVSRLHGGLPGQHRTITIGGN
jgi:hypothetical protein